MLAQIASAVTVGAVRGRCALRCAPAAASPADFTPAGSDVTKEELVKKSVSKSGAEEGSNRRQIMLALDANEASRRCVSWVADRLARPGDCVHLLNVVSLEKTFSPYRMSPGTLSETEPVLDPQLRAIEEEKSKGLLNDSASVFESKGIDCVSHLVLEHTWETVGCAVLDEAKALGVDVLVVASSGKGALKAAFEGSLTSFVVKHATMPVLAFPPPSRWAGV